jgi:hypothetical protein
VDSVDEGGVVEPAAEAGGAEEVVEEGVKEGVEEVVEVAEGVLEEAASAAVAFADPVSAPLVEVESAQTPGFAIVIDSAIISKNAYLLLS